VSGASSESEEYEGVSSHVPQDNGHASRIGPSREKTVNATEGHGFQVPEPQRITVRVFGE
jgi:hypothetical protein